jgi:hypothetical protein
LGKFAINAAVSTVAVNNKTINPNAIRFIACCMS